jgi:hypothetical protein
MLVTVQSRKHLLTVMLKHLLNYCFSCVGQQAARRSSMMGAFEV